MLSTNHELTAAQLRRTVDPQALGIQTTADLTPLAGLIGQPRAAAALRFGLGLDGLGFHIYVAGPPGLGKMTAVQTFLQDTAARKESPPDWCYVNNFDDPYQPKALQLPAGQGRQLQADLKQLIEHIRREIPKAFDSEEYGAKRDEITKTLNRQRAEIFERLGERATQNGFVLQMTPMGIAIVPVLGGRPLSEAEFQALPASAREDLQRRRETLEDEIKAAMKQVRDLERATQEQLQALDRQVALHVIGGLIEDLTEKYRTAPEVGNHLKAVQQDLLANLELFKPGAFVPPAPVPAGLPLPLPWGQDLPFRKYQVNVLVDNSHQAGAPVVIELNPSYHNLFGRIEKETQFGTLYTDFTLIKAGALHRANGGYLVLPAEDVLRHLFSWESLKLALRSRDIQIEDLGERLGFVAAKSLRPEPIPLDIKVVLVGQPLLYYLLHGYDEAFPELFKVKADFDTRMAWNEQNLRSFLAFLCTFCQQERLAHLDSGGAAKVVEHALRLAEDQDKLSTHFRVLGDLIREAHYWARQEGASLIGAAHVRRALDERVYRANLIQERVQEMIARGTLLVDTAGEALGQINGLSVISLGEYLFGKPSRITASVAPGREGIIDIEREVRLGGPLHSKGVLILSGYLAQRYAQDKPLTLAARLVFEQSYEGVEGDSASSAELYALLSALSGVPIKQGIAVTGSVNQHGEVQAIGGVNQKIEGFFDVCTVKRLTGEQGVIIPHSNLPHLMLREDVVEAVSAGRFHLWAVTTIDEGLEILTGVPAGARAADGQFPEGSVNAQVERRLQEFAQCLKEFATTSATEPHGATAGSDQRAHH